MSASTSSSSSSRPAARKPVIVFALLCGALFTGIIGTLGAIYVYELDPDQVSPELEWPSWMIYLCIPLGSYLMCFRFLQVMWRYLRDRLSSRIRRHGIEYEAPAWTARRRRPSPSRHDERVPQTLAPRAARRRASWRLLIVVDADRARARSACWRGFDIIDAVADRCARRCCSPCCSP